MSALAVSIGQWSDAGPKPVQQDFHGACIATGGALAAKGVALAIADGIGSSDVSQEASQHAVGAFLADYFSTPDAWTVKTSVERVVGATNAWLHAQTQRGRSPEDQDRGYVCTFAALVVKARTAHVFHVGDSRVQRLAGRDLEPLTNDHRVHMGGGQTYLSRALGVGPHVEIDYRAVPVGVGDVFLLTTDGVHEFVDGAFAIDVAARYADDLDAAARALVDEALRRGGRDNATAQLLRIDALPDPKADAFEERVERLPLPPTLEPRMRFDGYTILRELHVSHRSHLHLARDDSTGTLLVIKTPSTDLREDAAALERFELEDWVARRVRDPHVVAAHATTRPRNFLYVASEYVDGRTLAQWLRDHPRPRLDEVRTIVAQIAQGLRAFHRQEMLHRDLRPENVMIDADGIVRLIDLGSVHVAGLAETDGRGGDDAILGTEQYTAPEYFVGDGGTWRSDLYSLGVLVYAMLSGRLPYGAQASRVRTRAALAKLHYRSVLSADREIPAWIDGVLRKAVHPQPGKRYDALSEFVEALKRPDPQVAAHRRPALIERDPLLFWKGLSAVLLMVVLVLAYALAALRPWSLSAPPAPAFRSSPRPAR